MGRLLYFRGQQIGDGVVSVAADVQPQSPLAVHAGLYQETAAIATAGANRLYAVEVTVHWLKSTPEALTIAIQAAQAMNGQQGLLTVKTDETVTLRGIDWWMSAAERPQVRPGFGGRFIGEWTLSFEGTTAVRSS